MNLFVTKNIANNTLYSVQELHTLAFDKIVSKVLLSIISFSSIFLLTLH